jgi:hypothetical protein
MSYLIITEYGENSREVLSEPATNVQRVETGFVSAPLRRDTTVVVLFATDLCNVSFFHDDSWRDGMDLPDAMHSWPMPENAQVIRGARGGARIAVYPQDWNF